MSPSIGESTTPEDCVFDVGHLSPSLASYQTSLSLA